MKLMTDYQNNNYPVIVGEEALVEFQEQFRNRHLVYIIDSNVAERHSELVQALVNQSSAVIVNGGETLKTTAQYEKVIEHILDNGIQRQSVIVALGGGSVGDFAGFIAATVLRGVDYVQLPTTILAHDSAVGGKVGINAHSGKNLIGAFKRPSGVYYHPQFLTTLPYEEKLSGFGEIVKHAMLNSEKTVPQLQSDYPHQAALDEMHRIDYWLIKGIELKLKVVVEDETEQGKRMFLNLGHTFGHALEFVHKIPHGHAVLYGLLMMMILSDKEADPLFGWFKKLALPALQLESFDSYYQLMKKDKKNSDDTIHFVLLDQNNRPYMKKIAESELRHAFRVFAGLIGGRNEN